MSEQETLLDWEDLKFVLAVLRHGSLSAAARALGTTQATVSRRVDAFEAKAGLRLFDRSGTGANPTDAGRAIWQDLLRLEAAGLSIERRLEASDEVGGRLRITSLDWLGDHLIAPIAARFGAAHPSCEVELLNDSRVFNLSRGEADIAFRFGEFRQQDLAVRTIGHAAYGLYAAPLYLDMRGVPDFSTGCEGHHIVLLYEDAGTVSHRDWLAALASRSSVVLRTSGLQSHLGVLEAGVAVGVLPRFVGDRRPGLVRIAAPTPEPVQPIRMGVHLHSREAQRIRRFIDMCVDSIRAEAVRLRPPDDPAPGHQAD